jgi:methylated-DNA-[protein]-cysteine S-methyltransferase
MQYRQHLNTPHGTLNVEANSKGVCAITFLDKLENDLNSEPLCANAITEEACEQLSAYYQKKLTQFSLPIDTKGTPFQQNVWQALLKIPYGETVTYLDIAKAINNHKAVRAVGMANGRNPISIVIPCHRVVGSNNTLTGYAWGLQRKQFLLDLERSNSIN